MILNIFSLPILKQIEDEKLQENRKDSDTGTLLGIVDNTRMTDKDGGGAGS